jgi:undecaprenyl-diphosphatase
MNRTLLGIGVAAAVAAAVVAVYVAGHPYIPEDAVVERDVQSTAWGPLALTFPIFNWIGDAKGFFVEVAAFIAILIFNRRTWLVAAGAAVSAGWYLLLSHVILRPRPTTAQVLQVTEHPAASSFPSGHTIFIATIVVVLIVCLGYRFVRGRWRAALWIVGGAVIAANAIARMYTGAHWPSDVLAALLIATAWLCIWISIGPVYARIVRTSDTQARESESALVPSRLSSL